MTLLREQRAERAGIVIGLQLLIEAHRAPGLAAALRIDTILARRCGSSAMPLRGVPGLAAGEAGAGMGTRRTCEAGDPGAAMIPGRCFFFFVFFSSVSETCQPGLSFFFLFSDFFF